VSRPVWTPERDALFRRELPENTNPRALLDSINALPGVPVANVKAMMLHAHKNGLKRSPAACLEIQRLAGLEGNRKRTTIAGGRIITVWTDERRARLLHGRATGEDPKATLAALNALPGLQIAGLEAMRGTLKKMKAAGVHVPDRLPGPRPGTQPKSPPPVRGRKAAPPVVVEAPQPEPPPPPKPCPELADAAAEARLERLKDSVRRSMKKGRLEWESAVAIANRHGVTPRRVLIVFGMVRS
jgi:hypothetical protein